MKKIIHKSETRGLASHGWLISRHTFSFAEYYNPERVHFGALRVLNDDLIQGGTGFDTHPHNNMEIITIPIEGGIRHKDSMGNEAIINSGEIQVMSAGSGVYHSEYNASETEVGKFLQIWVFPNKKNVEPRYDQIKLDTERMRNNLLQIVSPNMDDEGSWVHQDAWFSIGELDSGFQTEYMLHKEGNGVYILVIEGKIECKDEILSRRDAMGLTEIAKLNINSIDSSKVLIIEVPMKF